MLLCNVLPTHAWLAAHAHMACAVAMDQFKTMMWGQQIAAHAVAIEEVIPVAWGLSLLHNIVHLILLEWAAQVLQWDGVEAPRGVEEAHLDVVEVPLDVVEAHTGVDLVEGLVDVAILVFGSVRQSCNF